MPNIGSRCVEAAAEAGVPQVRYGRWPEGDYHLKFARMFRILSIYEKGNLGFLLSASGDIGIEFYKS